MPIRNRMLAAGVMLGALHAPECAGQAGLGRLERARLGYEQTMSWAHAPSVPAAPALWGAYAIDPVLGDVHRAYNMPTRRRAERGAMASCKEASGRRCTSLGGFSGGCATYASDASGTLHVGFSDAPVSSAGVALLRCKAVGAAADCRLALAPLCVGAQFPGVPQVWSAQDLEALTRQLLARDELLLRHGMRLPSHEPTEP